MHKDAAFILAWQDGDTKSFDILYQRYVDKIFSYTLSKTGNRERAQDLTSETFCRLFDQKDRLDPAQGLSGYVYRIALNLIIDDSRRTSAQTADWLDDVSSDKNIKDQAFDAVLIQEIFKQLTDLGEEKKEIVLLRMQGMSYEEIGDILHKTPTSCRMQMSRTMKHLSTVCKHLLFLSIWIRRTS